MTNLASEVKKVFKNQRRLGPNRERTSSVNTVGSTAAKRVAGAL